MPDFADDATVEDGFAVADTYEELIAVLSDFYADLDLDSMEESDNV